MSNIIRKLTSRKLWLAVAGVATGVFIALGGDATDIETVAGAVTALVSAVTYIFAESRIDAESVKKAVEATQSAVEVFSDGDNI